MKPLLITRDLCHGGKRQPRLQDINLQLESGDRLALLGVNGAGKTTLMEILAGVLAPRSGQVQIEGTRLHRSANPVRRRIGFLPQRVAAYPELTVQENLAWSGRLQGLSTPILADTIKTTLEKVGLHEVVHRLCGQLSAGMRQRLGLAQALLHAPDILILDEPTASLDPVQTDHLRQLIADLPSSTSLILATHLLDDVRQLCDRVLVLDRGRQTGEYRLAPDTDLLALLSRTADTAA